MTTPKQRAMFLLIFAFVVFIVGAVTTTWADDGPTPEDLANLADIQANQKVIEENREAHERFLLFKGYNEAEVTELARNGWCPVWNEDPSKIELERCSPASAPSTPERIVNVSYTPSRVSDRARELLTGPCNGDEKCICVNNAIFIHDSSWSTSGVGARSLGPCNMRVPSSWTPSVPLSSMWAKHGEYAKFETLQDGVTACVELWQRFYEGKTAFATAKVWTGNANNKDYGSKRDERAYINAIAACD